MKLNKYAERIAELAKRHPDLDVVYAIDDEGNDFKRVVYFPDIGQMREGYFVTLKEIDKGNYPNHAKPTTVCIN